MSKKSREAALFIVDIFVALKRVSQYTDDFEDADSFRHSSLHWDATIRQLEMVGESLNHLLSMDHFSKYAPDYFRKIVNFRNVIVHEYFGIDAEEVWHVIQERLPLLHDDMTRMIALIDISDAIDAVLEESDDAAIVQMLRALKTDSFEG